MKDGKLCGTPNTCTCTVVTFLGKSDATEHTIQV